MRLSVLDQSTASKGRAQDTAIRESLELARHCDALGYHRYWVSEHHNSGSIVGTAPEVLMAAIGPPRLVSASAARVLCCRTIRR
jgi:alkanesulfonate monooxygenase SsuD/methylene tetrahydromethanopterin reductase-like flavin-dependent oxidoreductase (luciferase family)